MKIDGILIAVVAYGLGVATTYNFFRNRERARADAEIKSAIEHISNRVNGTSLTGVKESKDDVKDEAYRERSSIDSGKKQYEHTNYATKMTDITDAAERESPKEDDDDPDDGRPYEITIDEYFSLTGVEKKSLQWFKDNDVLTVTDSTEDDITPYGLIDDEVGILGDVLVKSKFKTDDFVDVIYIYNPIIMAAYEVSKVYGKYEW